jgi:hypothetical protein
MKTNLVRFFKRHLVFIFKTHYVKLRYYRNTLRDDAALLKGIPLSNAALCHVEALQIFYVF